jgi:hypothetical protein
MDYVIVHYAPFVIAAACFGFLVGWWAQGSSRRGTDVKRSEPTA